MHHPDEKQISCKRCQTRKIKCSRTSPCRRCTSAGVKCEYREEDSKRCPISREYVGALESRIANLESFLSELKSASVDDRNTMIDEIGFADHLSLLAASGDSTPRSDTSEMDGLNTNAGWGGSVDESPTLQSLYGTKIMRSYIGSSQTRQVYTSHPPSSIGFSGSHIDKCIALFFRWQDPCNMIMDRDYFLSEYSKGEISSSKSGQALLYAACALGCLSSRDRNIRQMADRFYDSAVTLLLGKSLLTSHVWTLQALLCCSLYENGRGNSSAGWMFSGMAIRMAQDLETQKIPEDLTSEEGIVRTSLVDTESRRRMLSNCYISDKMFGLMLGHRSAMFRCNNSSSATRRKPLNRHRLETTGLSEYREAEGAPDPSSILEKQYQLAEVLEDILSWNSSSVSRSKRWTEIQLNNINSKLCNWHDSLPSDLRWDRWGSRSDIVHPSIASLHMLYHTARLCLNSPIIPYSPSKIAETAIKVCDSSVDTIVSILHRFKQQHSLKNAPLSFVHGAIRASDANLALCCRFPLAENTNLQTLEFALGELSYSWDLAAQAHQGLQNLLLEIEFEKQDSSSVVSSSVDSELDTKLGFSPEQYSVLGEQNLGLEGQTGFHCDNFNGAIGSLWDPMVFVDDSLHYPIGMDFHGKEYDQLDFCGINMAKSLGMG